ncbi:DUF4184 family protein [Flavobacterium algicola]|uniref:DUF4184 family protein n=1 Tax=Flavobacterium algicola TaxID=556529 RepID=UPI001EFC3068|nr:DUF4184 family protein [Flavobacterium algicola]MCG9791634.1 DUF4184 family protein [Flavobacterium algicola]
MPFTFSHAAAVLPFLKNEKVSISALIVGSISPDLEYFFKMTLNSERSHTFLGIFTVDLPLGMLLLFMFHLLIKKALLQNLPNFIQARTQELLHSDWIHYFKNNFFTVLLSFIFGTLTHFLLDSLTHNNGYFVTRYSFYSAPVLEIPLFGYVYRFMSFFGLVYLVYYFYKLPVVKQSFSKISIPYWLLTVLTAAAVYYYRFNSGIVEDPSLEINLVVLVSSLVVGLIFSGLLFGRRKAI